MDKQTIPVGATVLFCGITTLVIVKVVNKVIPVRVCEKQKRLDSI